MEDYNTLAPKVEAAIERLAAIGIHEDSFPADRIAYNALKRAWLSFDIVEIDSCLKAAEERIRIMTHLL
jgi:hypothetical protein